jgi:hypothetical protein
MDDIISYKMCAVKVRNAKLRNTLRRFICVVCSSSAQTNLRVTSYSKNWFGEFPLTMVNSELKEDNYWMINLITTFNFVEWQIQLTKTYICPYI